mmetsp:Transcript_10382/g.34120  ORF Transcript_10382/g.34120 Transcript_10382/m.34120 type:complete len:228 (+) Transcript_10382:1190-1873(+)
MMSCISSNSFPESFGSTASGSSSSSSSSSASSSSLSSSSLSSPSPSSTFPVAASAALSSPSPSPFSPFSPPSPSSSATPLPFLPPPRFAFRSALGGFSGRSEPHAEKIFRMACMYTACAWPGRCTTPGMSRASSSSRGSSMYCAYSPWIQTAARSGCATVRFSGRVSSSAGSVMSCLSDLTASSRMTLTRTAMSRSWCAISFPCCVCGTRASCPSTSTYHPKSVTRR